MSVLGLSGTYQLKLMKLRFILIFHIFAILEFDLLIGYPLDKLFREKPSHGSLDKKFGKTAFATHSKIPMVKHYDNHDPFEQVTFVTLFISPPPLLEHKPCPSSNQNVVLDGGRDSTLILNDILLESKNFYAMDICLVPHAPTRITTISRSSFSNFSRV